MLIMFKLGEYDEDEARDIVERLKKAGIKVEMRPSICAAVEEIPFMEGRLSELREEKVEDIEAYDRYVDAMRKVLSEGVSDEGEFEERFLSMVDPSWRERRDRLVKFLEEWRSLTEEEKDERDEKEMDELKEEMDAALERFFAVGFAFSTLSLNEIKLGEGVGDRLDDPLIRVPVSHDAFNPDSKFARMVTEIQFDRCVDLYVDEFTAPMIDEVDEEFWDEYFDEHLRLSALGMLITELLDLPAGAKKKITLDEFREACSFEVDMDESILAIEGSRVAEDIAKVLEKKGIIKIRGDRITWRKG